LESESEPEPAYTIRLPAHLSMCIGVAPTGWIFIRFDTGDFYESLPRN